MTDFYRHIADHFDQNATDYDARYWENPVLQRLRQVLREEVKRCRFSSALEIGHGTGVDLCHFGSIFPERTFAGVDVSPRMTDLARRRIGDAGLRNVEAKVASIEQVPEAFPGRRFDLVYVFFGALNTVKDLQQNAECLRDVLTPGGTLVLSVVNRWYLADMAIGVLRGRGRAAFQRLERVWGGYSPDRPMQSRCYQPRNVLSAFGPWTRLRRRRGLCILYPAWYRAHHLKRLRGWAEVLWDVDGMLNHTPLWCTGEYALYTLQKR